MYRFKSAMRLFTATSTFSHSFGSFAPSRRSIRRKILPPEFSRNVVRLECESTSKKGVCEIFVIGTVHNYPKSGEDVKNLVNFLKPQVLFLELCSSRTDIIHYQQQVTYLKDPVDSEFRIAFKEANKFGAKVILGDRPNKITEMRYHDKNCRMPWRAMKIKIKKVKMLQAINEKYGDQAAYDDDSYKRTCTPDDVVYQLDPIYTEVFTYMSAKLLEVARNHSSIVAVVGKAHLLGIQKYWKQPVEVKQLLSVPHTCRNRKIVGVVGALAIFLAVLQYFFNIFY